MSRMPAGLAAFLLLPLFAPADPPAPVGPAGKWQVKFANGVVETCAFDNGTATEYSHFDGSVRRFEREHQGVV